ncbi:MAG: c-type cytochrome [Candidatus Kapabacteria bacterium]|nr:c-type cytochrome [Candidatus Kapabacteria bacterium]
MKKITAFIPLAYLIPLLGLAIGAMGFAIWLPHYTTSNSEYCLKCHGEKGGLMDRGIKSKIHPGYNKVTCVDCHSKDQKIIYEGYVNGFMADADRVSPNCMNCHPDIKDRNDTLGFKYNEMKIGIPHKLHLQNGAKCTDCHANLAHDMNEKPTNRPRMEYCSQCHATSSEPCGKCHVDKVPTGSYPQMQVAGLVGDGKTLYDKYCSSCHGLTGAGVEGVKLHSKELFQKNDLKSLREKTLNGHKNMPPFDINKGGSLNEDEVRSIFGHIKIASEGASANGQALYDSYCGICHGAKGSKIVKTDFSNLQYASKFSTEGLIKFMRYGKNNTHVFDKPFGGPLSYEAISAIAKYVPSLSAPKGDTAGAGGAAAANGFAIFTANCTECHGNKGNDIESAKLKNGDYLSKLGDRTFIKSVNDGIGAMPGFGKSAGGKLGKDDIVAVLTFLKVKAGLSTGETEGGATLQKKAPKIPHEISKDNEDCLECHSSDGIKPFPKDHVGRNKKMCKTCHISSKK